MTIKMSVNLFLTIFSVGIFLFLTPVKAVGSVIINEICPTGCAGSGYQWIEIYNNSDVAVDLADWKFLEGGTNHGLELSVSSTPRDYLIDEGEYAIITQDDLKFFSEHAGVSAAVFDSSWGTLNKGGETIGLKDNSGNLIEEFNYSAITNNSLERKSSSVAASEAGNWAEHPDSDTAGAQNYWYGSVSSISSDSIATSTTLQTDSFTTATTTTISAIVTTSVVINEFVSDPASGEKEWIELYNFSSSTIDLTGWKLFDNVGQIAAPTSTIAASGFFVVELSSNKLNNDGDIIILKNTADQIVDQVAYGVYDDGNIADNAPAVSDPHSIARSAESGDTGNDASDWFETTTLTKNAVNQITAPVQPVQSNSSADSASSPQASSGQGGGSSSPQTKSTVSYRAGLVVINEIVSDPTDDADEFIELFNNSNTTIDLRQWWLEDGSEARTNLDGQILPHGFFVVNNPAGNLNNSGDIIILSDPSGKTIDQLTYGNWNDGSLNDNAPSAEDPLSLARKIDGRDTDNDYYDFALTGQITRGAANKIVSLNPQGEKISEAIIISSPAILNEIFPNPKGSDTTEEFIELRNLGDSQINLSGWQLGDSSEKKYKINQGMIPANGYIAFKRELTGVALNNSGQEEVKLYNQTGALVDKVKYEGVAAEDQSYARREDGAWKWTIKTTINKENIIEGKSAAPMIVLEFSTEASLNEEITFDASDTTDPDGDAIKFNWDFGDSPSTHSVRSGQAGDVIKHAYNKIGGYSVKLTATDSGGNAAEKIVRVSVLGDYVGGWVDLAGQIIISEILPNPVGSDSAEFIELYNPTDMAINLSGYKLDDEDGGSRPYVLPAGTIIEPLSFLLLARSKTGLVLNNSNDAVRILDQDNNVVVEIEYDNAVEGASYAFDMLSGDWVWTSEITPGINNVRTYPSALLQQVQDRSGQAPKSGSMKEKKVIDVALDKIKDNDIGDRVKFTGIVAVRPGVLSSQYFYAVSDDGASGMQVYMNKKDFPLLAIGDLIEVTGEISSAYGEIRIKTSVREDIKLLKQDSLPLPQEIEIASISEELEGALVKIKGEITELKSSYMYVDDGTE
ncbi:MAG: lamin tail domain-containing protein [Candidatus Magasanikbacteria bacterium]|nr:lamin tail domain-containing protein [Candidatus Magasanikbacteria bacterium]